MYAQQEKAIQDKRNELCTECEVFWAFSDKQFQEGKAKHPLEPGEKYVSIGGGGYMPKRYIDKFMDGLEALNQEEKVMAKAKRAEKAKSAKRTRHLSCSCCGEDAPAYEQWWNQDTGYGLCGKCADMMGLTDYSESYGYEGINWFKKGDK